MQTLYPLDWCANKIKVLTFYNNNSSCKISSHYADDFTEKMGRGGKAQQYWKSIKSDDSPSIKIPTSSAQNEYREHVKHKNTMYNNNIIKKKRSLYS